ncbi:Rpn family recombination-promoting nuclease/putative transposase (plasmid) [Lactobacillus iners]|uniref:Rpn family recombination-promoting nuclease/putative transposase n=1 Tax=Lactobacillus iners TaxID=147802 RepID=UPI0013E191FB|nr:Rpn family recombination-promoting nuclease/putative transposase [Lactobacillus iners]QIH28332.1 Rpn family recombination-promoting nuclease/putative transposase [Lactobacillus iners]
MSIIKTNAMNNFANADITDDIFFCRIMSEKQYALPLLQRIFPQLNIRSIEQPISQFTIKNNRKEHGVRFDVFSEAEQKYFDIEMQTTHDPTLGKRIRYYQGKMDSTFLKAGESYDLLPPTYIVFICTFDPFAEGAYKYEFSHIYDQTNHVTLKTGTHVILLNAHGTNPGSINGGIIELFKVSSR